MWHHSISLEENVAKQGTYKYYYDRLVLYMYPCRRSGEISERLFQHCEVATTLWNASFSVFGLDCSTVDLLDCWKWRLSCLQSEGLWKMIPSCLLQFIWWERNNHSFEDKKKTMVDLKNCFLPTLYSWIVTHFGCSISNFRDFITLLHFLRKCFSPYDLR